MIRKIIDIYHERAQTRKALRLLNKQSWSVEFLTALLSKAAKINGKHLEMEIISKDGVRLIVRTTDALVEKADDDNIFNHLDDDVRINQFMNELRR